MATQIFNDEMMALLTAVFQKRYEPNFAWGNAWSMYMQLPGLLAFYPGSLGVTTGVAALRDQSGSGLHLSRVGAAGEAADSTGLRRWVNFNGTTEYFSVGDSAYNSILGTETSIESPIRGLTVMAWVRPTTAPGSAGVIASKLQSVGNQRSWQFLRTTGGVGQFIVSGDGAATVTISSTNILAQDEWRFVCARWTPSAQIKIWEGFTYGIVTNENTTSIPATLFDSTEALAVGAVNTSGTPANWWAGDLSLIAICRAALPDIFIDSIFDLTRPQFIRR